MLTGGLGEILSNVLWFHRPLPVALLIYPGNALEATIGTWILSRVSKLPVRLETREEVVVFVLVCAGIAPLIGAAVRTRPPGRSAFSGALGRITIECRITF